jgi:hypothetical protein
MSRFTHAHAKQAHIRSQDDRCTVCQERPVTWRPLEDGKCQRCRKVEALELEATNRPLVVSRRIYESLPPQSRRGLWPEGR